MKKEITNHTYYDISSYRSEIMGIATLLIVVHHILIFCKPQSTVLNYLLPQLNIGVDVFLFISGVGLYFACSKKDYSFKSYYIKRILNVYVMYIIIYFPFVLYQGIVQQTSVGAILFRLSGLEFWFTLSQNTWYIHWIMLLYLIYPLAFRLYKKCNYNQLLFFTLLIFAAVITACVLLSRFSPDFYNVKEIAITRIPVFFVGGYFGKIVYNKEKIKKADYLILAVFGIIGVVIKTNNFKHLVNIFPPYRSFLQILHIDNYSYKPYTVRFASALIVPLLVVMLSYLLKKLNFSSLNQVLRLFGNMSLEVYLLHVYIASLLLSILSKDNLSPLQYALVILITLLLAYPLSKLRKAITGKFSEKKKYSNM